MITWPCHMIWLPKFPCCLYLDPIVWFEVLDWVFNCTGNYFHFGTLITSCWIMPATYTSTLFALVDIDGILQSAKRLPVQFPCLSFYKYISLVIVKATHDMAGKSTMMSKITGKGLQWCKNWQYLKNTYNGNPSMINNLANIFLPLQVTHW